MIVASTLAPANVHNTEAALDFLEGVQGWALGDRNYWKPELQASLQQQELKLRSPY